MNVELRNRHRETAPFISDYVLGLLSSPQAKQVEGHLAACVDCRRAARQERALAQAVRTTLAAATRPDGAWLAALMPASPARRGWLPARFWRPAAALALFLILALGSLQLNRPGLSPASTALAATATQTPTMTLTIAAASPLPVAPAVGADTAPPVLPARQSPGPLAWSPQPTPARPILP